MFIAALSGKRPKKLLVFGVKHLYGRFADSAARRHGPVFLVRPGGLGCGGMAFHLTPSWRRGAVCSNETKN
jgi:hypothetical protein